MDEMTVKGYKIDYEFLKDDGWKSTGLHLFTSKDIYGVFSMSRNFKVARDGVASQIDYLVKKNE